MSKIEKNITIPKDSSIKIDGSDLTITGPKEQKLSVNDKIFSSKLNDSQFQIQPSKKVDKNINIVGNL